MSDKNTRRRGRSANPNPTNFNQEENSEPQDFACPICEVNFNLEENIPLTLPCGHIICKLCLEETQQLSKRKICPLDKKEYNNFQKNQYIANFIEKTKKFVCKMHKKQRIKYYCEYDNSYFCQLCKPDHSDDCHNVHKFIPDDSIFKELEFLNSRILNRKQSLNDELKKIHDCRLLLVSKNKEQIIQIESYISDFIARLNKLKEGFIEKIQKFYADQFDIIEKGKMAINNEFMNLEDIQKDVTALNEIKDKTNLIYEDVLEKKMQVLQKWEKQLKFSSTRESNYLNRVSEANISLQSFSTIEKSLMKCQFDFLEKNDDLSATRFSSGDERNNSSRKVNSERKYLSNSSVDSNRKKESKRKGSDPTVPNEKMNIETQLNKVEKKPLILTEKPPVLFLPINNIKKRTFEKKGNSFRQQNTTQFNTFLTNTNNDGNKNFNKNKKALVAL